ncbi:hypothetical protein [Picosynechococcus sp. NKBG15041c]|uniref:hypothetical protein n=1 Tax=Picosynechococcus sp. NKBG15041c TaxID=1407650 RepID=UPI00041C25A4|nr:hypothetical protein [Picosynechococcus sp. NKBG15041c]
MDALIKTLIQAGLLSETQAQVVRYDAESHPDMSLGEILALRGWATEETIDFFELLWEMRYQQPDRKNIGQYLLEAHLITQEQLDDILVSQQQDTWGKSLRFGEIAVLKGYVKQPTIRFFVEHLFPDQLHKTNKNPFARISLSDRPSQSRKTTLSQGPTETETPTPAPHGQAPQRSPHPLVAKFTAPRQAKSVSTPKKPDYEPEEAFATNFDLLNAEDFDPGQLR